MLTNSRLLVQKAKQDKQSNEEMFSFLVDPKDVSTVLPTDRGLASFEEERSDA